MHKLLLPASAAFLFLTCQANAQDCSAPFVPSEFKVKRAWFSNESNLATFCTPSVANMNPQEDDMPEIIICSTKGVAAPGPRIDNQIHFYRGDGSNFYFPMVLTLPEEFSPTVPGPTIGDINKDGIPELIMPCMDFRIRVYTGYKEDLTDPMKLWVTSAASEPIETAETRVSLADFDGDGIPELYAGSDIYQFDLSKPAIPVLKRVIKGPFFRGRSMRDNYGQGQCSPAAVDILSVADCNGDPDCAGLELVAGPVIYSVDLDASDGDGIEIKIQRNLNQLHNSATYEDGYTSVGDLDLDGVLDIAVSGRRNSTDHGVFTWNKNGLLHFFPFPLNDPKGGGLPCITNVYRDDGIGPDLPEILVSSRSNLTCFNLNAAQMTPATPYWWRVPCFSTGGMVGVTAFDLNGDGHSEILYRDRWLFRILYGGAAPFPPGVDAQRTWFTHPCQSSAVDEYPVVADVDNDGQAEVVVAGSFSMSSDIGHLIVFESGGGPWVPCRKVWNQYNYLGINVNDDLSIPAQQLPNHHLEFPASGSGKRPFNNYLVQRPLLNANFEIASPLPDATAEISKVACNTNDINVQVSICNKGDKVLQTGTPVAIYQSNPTTTNAALLGAIQHLQAPIQPGACLTLSLMVPNTVTSFFGVVNDNGTLPRPYQLQTNFPVTSEPECDWLNNLFQFNIQNTSPIPDLGPDLSFCKDTSITLHAANPGYASYRWQDGSTHSSLQAQQPGLYWVEVTDFCARKHTDSIRLEQLERPVIQLDTINGDCSGAPASVTASASSIYPPLTYQWSTSATTPSLSGLTDGTYTVTVTNARGCTSTSSSWVEAGGNLHVTASATPIPCHGQTSSVQLDFVTGKAPYHFKWSDNSTGPDLLHAPSGNYSVTVTDADLCTQILQIAVDQPGPLVSLGIALQAACPGEANGGAAFSGASQGTAPYTLRWSTNATTSNLNGLASGAYQLTVTDANGCELVEHIQLPEFSAPAITAKVSDASCFGKQDGSISVTVQSGTPGFEYQWSNQSAASNIDLLSPGNYTLTLTYADGKCAQTADFEIKEPLPILLSSTASPATCNGGLGGSIDLDVQNGTLPLAFSWSNAAVSEDLNNLPAGVYEVTVMDAAGCTQTYAQTVAGQPGISLNASLQQPKCAGGADGSIQITPGGGVSPFQFNWSNGGVNASISGLPAGSYTVTVTDAAACMEVLTVSVQEPAPLNSGGTSILAACPGMANGAATYLGATQGTPPYSLQWSTSATTANLTGLASGSYQLSITDANGCELVEMVQVPEFSAPATNAVTRNVSCFDASDGSIAIEILSGSPGFEYEWSNQSTASKIENLLPGKYTLTLTYADGKCEQIFDYQIQEPLPLILSAVSSPATCQGGLGGSIDLTVQNGIAPLSFLWSNAAITEDLNNISAGSYQVTMTDATGCSKSYGQNVPELLGISLNILSQQPKCAGGADGSIQVNPGGGTSPFQFKWSNGESGTSISGLLAGTYTVTVTDAAACTEISTTKVDQPTPLISHGISTSAACPGSANGAAAFLGATQGTPPYTLRWSTNAVSPALTDLATGAYTLTITDANGCELLETVQVPEFSAPQTQETVSDVTCFGKNDGSISVAVVNGSPGFGFFWSNQSTTPQIEHLAPGDYALTLTYADGKCVQTAEYQIEEPMAIALLDTLMTAARCFGEPSGAIDISTTGGIPPYQFNWASGQKTEDITQLAAGAYTLTLTDANACPFVAQFIVVQPALLALHPTIHADTCYSSGGAIVTTATGGMPPYQFSWSNAASGSQLNQLAAGHYALTMTDANGCTHLQDLQVPTFGENPVLVPFTGLLTCAQPTVAIGVTADQTNLTYTWSGPGGSFPNQATQTISVSGNYLVAASNAWGCRADAAIQVLEDKTPPIAEAGTASIQIPCTATETLLNAAGSSQGGPFQHRWTSVLNGNTVFDTMAVLVTIHQPGLYFHTVLNTVNGCMAKDSILVHWSAPIQAAVSIDSIRCYGDADGVIRIGNIAGGTAPFRYSIDQVHFSNQPVFSGLLPGQYPVRVEDNFGCSWETSVVLTEPDSFAVQLTASDTAIELGHLLRLTAAPWPKNKAWNDLIWEPSHLEFVSGSLQQKVRPEQDTEITVRIIDKNGCAAEDRLSVAVHNYNIYTPNAIRPESSQNSRFTIFAGDGVREIRLMRVFDRWGELVFERRHFSPNDPDAGWDGSFRGQPLPPGVFGWYAEALLQDGRVLPLKGDVTLIK